MLLQGGDTILTYQDWEKSIDKLKLIEEIIDDYKNSKTYKAAKIAQEYYRHENRAIIERYTYLEKMGIHDSQVIFHKLSNGLFPKFVRQESQYLLGNGVSVSDEAKKKLGTNFDTQLQEMGMQALVDGVNWGFWNVDKLVVFRATEFAPLFDERTSELRLGVRFWQIDSKKPTYVEVYGIDGITTYEGNKSAKGFIETGETQTYMQTVHVDDISSDVLKKKNYGVVPVFPLYANDVRKSEFTKGVKGLIDAYDFISSDLVDGITLIEGVYWVVKNYGGNDVAELITELQKLKATYTDSGDSSADSHTIEIPYQAKETALKLIERQLYADFMALDIKAMTGGSLTNVAINVAKTDFDLKVDLFEWQVLRFVRNILDLIGFVDEEILFKRRTITNDTEMVQNIYLMRDDLDHQTALELNPLIPDMKVDDVMDRYAAEQLGIGDYEDEEDKS